MREFKCTEEQFLKDVKDHVLHIAHDDGSYRHLRFRKPGTMHYSFDIIAWPGWLCYSGDMGCFVFERNPDMLSFFRDSGSGMIYINPEYWAEKLEAVDIVGGHKEFSKPRFEETLRDIVDDDGGDNDELSDEVEQLIADCGEDERECRQAVEDFEYNGKPYFHDFWEHDLTEFTYRYIWCCYALVWGIRKYDVLVGGGGGGGGKG